MQRSPIDNSSQSASALTLAMLCLLCFLSEPARAASENLRVSVVGVDGAAWRVIDPMLERGELPSFQKLIENGVRGQLQSELPLRSPAIWTTVATGMNRERHGIEFFGNRLGFFISSRDRRVPALWTIASERGLRSAIIGWWATFPAEPIRGVIISERALKTREKDIAALMRPGRVGPRDPLRLTYPADVLEIVVNAFGRMPESPHATSEMMRVKHNMRDEDAVSVQALLELRQKYGRFDLELLLLRGVDPVSHFFWKYHEPEAAAYTAA